MRPFGTAPDGQGTVVIRSGEATDGVGRDAGVLTRKSAEVAGTEPARNPCGSGRPLGHRPPGSAEVGLAEVELPPADVPPLAVLEADVLVDAYALEAEGLVDADARVVRE